MYIKMATEVSEKMLETIAIAARVQEESRPNIFEVDGTRWHGFVRLVREGLVCLVSGC